MDSKVKIGDLIIELDMNGCIEDLTIILEERDYREFNEERWICYSIIEGRDCDFGDKESFVDLKYDNGCPWYELVEL